MTHIPFTITAYFFNALAVTANKFLLKRAIPDPLIYVFFISLASLLVIFGLPFTKIPALDTFMIASISTLLWTTGAYFMFKALKIGQVSRVIPIIGTLIPLILLISAAFSKAISTNQIISVVILLIGMIFLTSSDWTGKLQIKEILLEVFSAAFFAFSYLSLKLAYLKLDFFSTLIWSRLILLPVVVVMFLMPSVRQQLMAAKGQPVINFFSQDGLIFLSGQITGTASELLLLFSISLANPALVNSLQGTQYIFLLILSFILAKKYPAIFQEKQTLGALISKAVGIALIGIGLYLLAFS